MRGPTALRGTSRALSAIGPRAAAGAIRGNQLVEISSIGRTAGGRDLEVMRIGDPAAPYRVFVRARAHPWEAGSSWVAEGLIRETLEPG